MVAFVILLFTVQNYAKFCLCSKAFPYFLVKENTDGDVSSEQLPKRKKEVVKLEFATPHGSCL